MLKPMCYTYLVGLMDVNSAIYNMSDPGICCNVTGYNAQIM